VSATEPGLARYRACFEDSWSDTTPLDALRFVVLDSETTGLDPRTDRLVSIGAVAVRDGEILLDDSFEAVLRVDHNTSAVVVHGITRESAEGGMEESDAVLAFLDYLRDGVIVGHHLSHDVAMLDRALERHFGLSLRNRHLDTMALALHLEDDGAFGSAAAPCDFSLDALCERFGIAPRDRHTASGDAFLTAQVFLRLLRRAVRHGRDTLATLAEPYTPRPSE
jgi:DNA polymerase III subunit epsilon